LQKRDIDFKGHTPTFPPTTAGSFVPSVWSQFLSRLHYAVQDRLRK
jgi:hypothetical protein